MGSGSRSPASLAGSKRATPTPVTLRRDGMYAPAASDVRQHFLHHAPQLAPLVPGRDPQRHLADAHLLVYPQVLDALLRRARRRPGLRPLVHVHLVVLA